MKMPTHKLTAEVIHAAIDGFQSQKTRIDAQIAELRAMLPEGRTEPAPTPGARTGKRRKMSAAARKRIGDAQRKRWAASKGQSVTPAAPVTVKPKRKLSAAGRAAIVAALKRRWKEKKAAAKKTAPAVAKTTAVKKVAAKKAAPVRAAKKTSGKGPQKKAAKEPEQTAPVGQ